MLSPHFGELEKNTRTYHPSRRIIIGAMAGLRIGAVLGVWIALEGIASAQSWVPPRTRPSLNEIVAVDATGEDLWAYGEENIDPEIDLRTAYVAVDPELFYVRLYMSTDDAVPTDVDTFVFIDADADEQTGGPADHATLVADLPADPTPGGYDYVIGIAGNGMITEIWEWTAAQDEYATLNLATVTSDAEAGTDLDPIGFIMSDHGYVQASVELGAIGLTQACSARFFFRTLDASGGSDADGGGVVPCVSLDANSDGIPDVVVVDSCDADEDCPAGGICLDGTCYLATPCVDDTNCQDDEECSPEGLCTVVPGGMCAEDTDCGELVCDGGQCVACDPDVPDRCGPGRRCAPDGRCVPDGSGMGGAGGGDGDEPGLGPGEKVQGGACSCAILGGDGPLRVGASLALAGAGLALWWRRRRREARFDRNA